MTEEICLPEESSTAYPGRKLILAAFVGVILMGRSFNMAGTYRPTAVLFFTIPVLIAALLQLFLPAYSHAGGGKAENFAVQPSVEPAI